MSNAVAFVARLGRRSRLSRAGFWSAALLVYACAAPAGKAVATPPPDSPGFLLGGIQVREPDVDHWLTSVEAVGFNTISVTVYARQGRWDAAELTSDAREDWVVPEIRAAKKRGLAVVLILRVALEHALEDNLFLWHGMIQPRDEPTLRRWFDAYGDFAERWAKIAAAEGVDVLGIGSELNSMASTRRVEELPVLEEYYLNADKQAAERDKLLAFASEVEPRQLKAGWGKTYETLPRFLDERSAAQYRWARQVTFGGDIDSINARRRALEQSWRRLIARLRGVYPGRLTYAANFDQYPMVGFWDALDMIGINAYFPLRSGDETTEETSDLLPVFQRSWSKVLSEIEELRRSRGLESTPVLFTELGYTYRAGSTIHPWAGSGFDVLSTESGSTGNGEHKEGAELVVWDEEPIDLAERALAVRALRSSLGRIDHDLLGGLLYWKLSTVEAQRDIEPFVLVIGTENRDPLLTELVALADRGASARVD